MVIKTLWYWQNDRHTNQWNRIENPKIDPYKYAQVIFHKSAKAVFMEEESSFQNILEKSDNSKQKKKRKKRKEGRKNLNLNFIKLI